MNDILKRAEELTAYAKAHLELDERDGFYVKNRLLEILQNCENEELSEEADEVYGVLSLLPSAINRRFSEIYQESGSKAATDWFQAIRSNGQGAGRVGVCRAGASRLRRFAYDGRRFRRLYHIAR